MNLLNNFRHFLFPFDQETLEVPKLEAKTPKYSYINRRVDIEETEENTKFDASDSFLYLSHL